MVKEIPIESIIRDMSFNMRKPPDKQVIGDYREHLVEMEKKQRSVGQSLINKDVQSIHIPTFDVK